MGRWQDALTERKLAPDAPKDGVSSHVECPNASGVSSVSSVPTSGESEGGDPRAQENNTAYALRPNTVPTSADVLPDGVSSVLAVPTSCEFEGVGPHVPTGRYICSCYVHDIFSARMGMDEKKHEVGTAKTDETPHEIKRKKSQVTEANTPPGWTPEQRAKAPRAKKRKAGTDKTDETPGLAPTVFPPELTGARQALVDLIAARASAKAAIVEFEEGVEPMTPPAPEISDAGEVSGVLGVSPTADARDDLHAAGKWVQARSGQEHVSVRRTGALEPRIGGLSPHYLPKPWRTPWQEYCRQQPAETVREAMAFFKIWAGVLADAWTADDVFGPDGVVYVLPGRGVRRCDRWKVLFWDGAAFTRPSLIKTGK